MAEPNDMIVPLLREMRSENHAEHEQTRSMISAVEQRLGKVDEAQVSYRHALVADTMFGKFAAGDFEERIQALEEKMRQFEGRS